MTKMIFANLLRVTQDAKKTSTQLAPLLSGYRVPI